MSRVEGQVVDKFLIKSNSNDFHLEPFEKNLQVMNNSYDEMHKSHTETTEYEANTQDKSSDYLAMKIVQDIKKSTMDLNSRAHSLPKLSVKDRLQVENIPKYSQETPVADDNIDVLIQADGINVENRHKGLVRSRSQSIGKN